MPGLVPGIHVFGQRTKKDVDGRDIGVRKHAVLRTAMPGHDNEGVRSPPRHSGARAQRANPESSDVHRACLWIPGPALRAVPE